MEPLQAPSEVSGGIEPHNELADRLRTNIAAAMQLPDEVLTHVLVVLLAEGHALVEDFPGVGKTTLARALARSLDCRFARIQCTSDLMPADLVGVNIYDQREQKFVFRAGPVFANIVLVDEINRASPKTQSGLLECMQEGNVTVDGGTHELAAPFMVIATQNPIEYEGTYPLPEAQVDRFMMRLAIGYPPRQAEAAMLADNQAGDPVNELVPVASAAQLLAAQAATRAVHTADPVREYVVSLLWCTRQDPRVAVGASPRAGLMLLRAAKALALISGRDHVLPDDVQALAQPVLSHRLVMATDALTATADEVVADALRATRAL